jgi:small-conductance mechanosensitive channel
MEITSRVRDPWTRVAEPGAHLQHRRIAHATTGSATVHHSMPGGPTLAFVLGAALILIAATVAHITLRRWARRRERRDDAAVAAAPTLERRARWWLSRSIRDCAPPLLLLIWIQGLQAALGFALRTYAPPAWTGGLSTALAWSYGLSVTGAAYWLLARLGVIVEALLLAGSRRWDTAWDNLLLPIVGKAVRRLLPLAAFAVGASLVPLSAAAQDAGRKLIVVAVIASTAWLLVQVVDVAVGFILRRHPLDVKDNLQARAIHTQLVVLRKVANTVIGVFTLASMLMVFDSARHFGASILASAGIAGIVVGLAAQRSIGTLLAGFQIALTQPIRVDDVVIVEGEWGQVEDITLTYVVVRIWDQRRLIVPITHFIEQPFQNWTRSSADLLATVFLHVDYTMPLDELRAELTRVLHESRLWDGKVNVLQVTDAREQTLEVRALASAANASQAWDLRCEVRERLIRFVQREHPDSLPHVRAILARTHSTGTHGSAESRRDYQVRAR